MKDMTKTPHTLNSLCMLALKLKEMLDVVVDAAAGDESALDHIVTEWWTGHSSPIKSEMNAIVQAIQTDDDEAIQKEIEHEERKQAEQREWREACEQRLADIAFRNKM